MLPPLERAAAATAASLSRRQLFRQLPAPAAVLARIDADGLGRARPRPRPRTQPEQHGHAAVDDPTAQAFRRNVRFVAAATTPTSIPPATVPEVAFAGRSNVGKSSLLNALCETTQVRVSATPGLTRSLNFYRVGSWLQLVDMPGYGFAFASDEARANWQQLIATYLCERKELRRLFVLLDGRHGLKVNDVTFLDDLDRLPVKYQVVLTKCDLVDPVDLAKRVAVIEAAVAQRPQAVADVMMVSSRTHAGVPKLQRVILHAVGHRVAAPASPPEADPGDPTTHRLGEGRERQTRRLGDDRGELQARLGESRGELQTRRVGDGRGELQTRRLGEDRGERQTRRPDAERKTHQSGDGHGELHRRRQGDGRGDLRAPRPREGRGGAPPQRPLVPGAKSWTRAAPPASSSATRR